MIARRQSAVPDDNDTLTYALAGTELRATESLELGGPGTPEEPFTYTVLRSPVRQGDQITLFDRIAVPTGLDIDGDRLADLADLAAYSRVIGNESVELPDLQRSITALRVDTTYLVRFKRSSNGQVEPAFIFVDSTWYAPGIGIVRRSSSVPPIGSEPASTSDERLLFWDGVTEGLGALMPVRVGTASETNRLNRTWSAVRVGDRAMLASLVRFNDIAGLDRGMILSAVDSRGTVLSSQTYADLPATYSAGALLPLAGGVALVATEENLSNPPFVSFDVRMRRYDSNGAAVGPSGGMVLVSSQLVGAASAASDGEKVWVTWVQSSSNNSGVNNLMLAAFDAEGRIVVPAQVLDSDNYFGFPSNPFLTQRFGATTGRVMLSWSKLGSLTGTTSVKYLLASGNSVAYIRTLGASEAGPVPQPTPVISASRQSLAWTGAAGPLGVTDLLLRAVAIGDDGALLPTRQAPLVAQVLDAIPELVSTIGASPGASVLERGVPFADGNSFKAAVARTGRLLPALDPLPLPFIQVNEWSTVAPLADTTPTVTLRRLTMLDFGAPTSLGDVQHVLSFDDRLLVIGQVDGSATTAAVIFKR